MASATLNLAAGQKAERKLEMHFINVGTTESPEWELLGRGVEDASMEFNHDANQVTDILGITDVDVSAAKPTLELSPNTIRAGQKLSEKLLDIERRNATSELSTSTSTATSARPAHLPPRSTRTAPSSRPASAAATTSVCRFRCTCPTTKPSAPWPSLTASPRSPPLNKARRQHHEYQY